MRWLRRKDSPEARRKRAQDQAETYKKQLGPVALRMEKALEAGLDKEARTLQIAAGRIQTRLAALDEVPLNMEKALYHLAQISHQPLAYVENSSRNRNVAQMKRDEMEGEIRAVVNGLNALDEIKGEIKDLRDAAKDLESGLAKVQKEGRKFKRLRTQMQEVLDLHFARTMPGTQNNARAAELEEYYGIKANASGQARMSKARAEEQAAQRQRKRIQAAQKRRSRR